MGKIIAAHAVILLKVADDGLDGRAPSHVAFDLRVTLHAFTACQRDVLRLIVQGMSNKEIARALNLGGGSVKVHMAALFRKLGVNRRAAVAVVGARLLTEMAA